MKNMIIVARSGFALLTVYAIYVQMIAIIHLGAPVSNFFSYFTIESNIIAAVSLLVSSYFLITNKDERKLMLFRGAATLYMVVTGIIYVLLLRNVDVQTSEPWINTVLHYIMPVVMLIDFIFASAKTKISFKKALTWLGFPLLYVVYSLLRGPVVNWYPYPFLDPRTNGYVPVAVTSLLIFIASIVLVFALVAATNRRSHSNKA